MQVSELDSLLASGAIGEMTLVYADVEGFPFESWTTWSKAKKYFGHGGSHDGVVVRTHTHTHTHTRTHTHTQQSSSQCDSGRSLRECASQDVGEKCTSLFYVDEGGISSFEIPYDEVGPLVEAGTIQSETLCYSDQAAWPHEAWEPWAGCNACFGPGD